MGCRCHRKTCPSCGSRAKLFSIATVRVRCDVEQLPPQPVSCRLPLSFAATASGCTKTKVLESKIDCGMSLVITPVGYPIHDKLLFFLPSPFMDNFAMRHCVCPADTEITHHSPTTAAIVLVRTTWRKHADIFLNSHNISYLMEPPGCAGTSSWIMLVNVFGTTSTMILDNAKKTIHLSVYLGWKKRGRSEQCSLSIYVQTYST